MSERRGRVGSFGAGPFTVLVAAVVAIYLGVHYVGVQRVLPDLDGASPLVEATIEAVVLAALTAGALWFLVIRDLRRQAKQQQFEMKLGRALEMASNDQAAFNAIHRVLSQGLGRLLSELLLADSSQAHLKQAVAVGAEGRGPGCPVESPRDCPAVRRAQTLVFTSSEDVDACPHLEGRASGACSAVCVPVSVGGRSIGVLHATGPAGHPPDEDETSRLEALADRSGARIGMLRVLEQTHLQAATDPLTGLLNRRAFENRAQELLYRGTPFALAMGDLDHFKVLNDTHGHEAGDRALRLFARTVRAALRADDLVSRYGGEEFVLLFPGKSAADAGAALERIQAQLSESLSSGAVPPFTVSFGVAHSDEVPALEDLVRAADAALFRAKRDGRNRVVLDAVEVAIPEDDATESAAA